MKINKECKTKACEGKHKAKGFCDKHYRQYLHHGRLNHALGFCLAHYKRFIDGKNITESIQERPARKSNKLCNIMQKGTV